jgi:hypothetical protein
MGNETMEGYLEIWESGAIGAIWDLQIWWMVHYPLDDRVSNHFWTPCQRFYMMNNIGMSAPSQGTQPCQ